MEDLQQARRMSELAGFRPTWFAEEERKLAEESQRERFRHQQLKHQMLNDKEKLILLRKVHEPEEATEKTRSVNEQIVKENEDLRRMLRSMLEKEPQTVEGREESVYEDHRFSTPGEFKKNAEKGQTLFEDEKRTETRKGGEPASQVE